MPSLKRRDDDLWVVVAHATGQPEAEIIAGLLRTAEIPCYVQQESVGRVLGISFGSLGLVAVLVPIAYEEEAIALLDSPTLDDGPLPLDGPSIDFPPRDT